MYDLKHSVFLIFSLNFIFCESELVCPGKQPASWSGTQTGSGSAQSGTGQGSSNSSSQDNTKAIGCCPDDITGTRYFENQGCCCGQIYDNSTEFCCSDNDNECKGIYKDIPMPEEDKFNQNCYNFTCSEPHHNHPNNGSIELTGTKFICAGLNDGDKCVFGCADGYDLHMDDGIQWAIPTGEYTCGSGDVWTTPIWNESLELIRKQCCLVSANITRPLGACREYQGYN